MSRRIGNARYELTTYVPTLVFRAYLNEWNVGIWDHIMLMWEFSIYTKLLGREKFRIIQKALYRD